MKWRYHVTATYTWGSLEGRTNTFLTDVQYEPGKSYQRGLDVFVVNSIHDLRYNEYRRAA